jgi:hypothetical protein
MPRKQSKLPSVKTIRKHISGAEPLDAIERLCQFLTGVCRDETEDGFVYRLAKVVTRWGGVSAFLLLSDRVVLEHIAVQSPQGGFSVGNLKAHYVLDEDFVNSGSAFVLFSLVGTTWTLVVPVCNQNRFTSLSDWLAGGKRHMTKNFAA